MKIILLLFFIGISGTCTLAQTKKTPVIQPGVPYDTVQLKNETKLIYSSSDEHRVIRMISPDIDTVINTISIKYPKSSMGWLKADYDSYFVLYNGQAGFNYMRIFSKQNGKMIASGNVIEFDTINNIICYENGHSRDLLNLFNFKTSKFEKYITPTVPCLHWWYCIRVIEITGVQLILEVTGKNNIKSKSVYTRKKL